MAQATCALCGRSRSIRRFSTDSGSYYCRSYCRDQPDEMSWPMAFMIVGLILVAAAAIAFIVLVGGR